MGLRQATHRCWTRQLALTTGVLMLFACLLMWASTGTAAPQDSVCTNCKPLKPTDGKRCVQLEEQLSRPAQFVSRGQAQLDRYEPLMQEFMEKLCYRAWKHDSTARDTGPYTATLVDGQLKAQAYNQHAVSRVWYSPPMFDWMERYRPTDESTAPLNQPAPPNGSMMVKEMWTPPLARWAATCFDCVKPDGTGAVFWIRDDNTFSSGWFGSWYGPGWAPDWPPAPSNPLTGSGQGGSQFCSNCHASTVSGNTFVSMRNYFGKDVHRFLTQFVPDLPPATPHHMLVALPSNRVARLGEALYDYDDPFVEAFKGKMPAPEWGSVDRMPSQTYDDLVVGGKKKVILGKDPVYFQTSTQCLGCHTANATGLQFDMVAPVHQSVQTQLGGSLYDVSPYALWASSPMGMAGRDPIFFAQLESEQRLHPKDGALVQDTCLQCHGIMGQRQYALDVDDCGQFQRSVVNSVPYPSGNPTAANASYGALARDGISCTTCHHVVLGEEAEKNRNLPVNRCVEQKQKSFNPPATHAGFSLNFTGNFLLGPESEINGPFPNPLTKLMENSLGVKPIHNTTTLMSSEMCGTCHTVHLPVLDNPQNGINGETGKGSDPFKRYPKVYEQTTYPEWVFSAYRTGQSDGKPLPLGPGDRAKSCQGCHMPDSDDQGIPYSSKIASIEEFSNYPETDYRLPAADIDLQSRAPYGRHTLVGLNVFFLKMAQQFPDILGIRINDVSGLRGAVAPLVTTEQQMLDQAKNDTATIKVTPSWDATKKTLTAQVEIDNKVGHKFPSGVSFRRAFISLEVLDKDGNTLWASGRTNDVGTIVDDQGIPIAGEYWWKADCSARVPLADQKWQEHYTVIARQDQAQIYQELQTDKHGLLTTSFLSIDGEVKDNRLLPHGFLPEADRMKIAKALGDTTPLHSIMDENVGSNGSVGSKGVNGDEDYQRGGGDHLSYVASNLKGAPATIRATLYYQSIAPYFLQDRFCVAPDGPDTQRLYFLAGHLNLDGTEVEGWKLKVAQNALTCSTALGQFRCS
ncbi:MAG: hypothetical protein QOE77_3871 [Blastocatellia bacterium]|nr:hypothetical protein [Blastocatellia bacterium]